jgi:hypothetical protein
MAVTSMLFSGQERNVSVLATELYRERRLLDNDDDDERRRIFNDAVGTCLKVLSRISHGVLEENGENLRIAGDVIVTGTKMLSTVNCVVQAFQCVGVRCRRTLHANFPIPTKRCHM